MLEMMHRYPSVEEGPIAKGDQDKCNNDLLMIYIKNKKHKKK
jgi:hypothetical protein